MPLASEKLNQQRSDFLTLSSQESSSPNNLEHQQQKDTGGITARALNCPNVEKAVKRLEFGRINNRSNLYLRDAIGSPTKRETLEMQRQDTLSKMSLLRRNDSDFSQAAMQ